MVRIAGKPGYKFMQVLDPAIYRQLDRMAKPLGVNVQELIRVKIVPEFIYGPIVLNPHLVRTLVARSNRKVSRWDKWKYPRRKENNGKK